MILPIMEGEFRAADRWGAQFVGTLLEERGNELRVLINRTERWLKKADLLWYGFRWTGDGTAANLPALPVEGFQYPAAHPATPELENSPILGIEQYVNAKT